MSTKTATMAAQKRITLIVHDNLKKDLVDWCIKNEATLKSHFLCGTGTTARLIAEATGLPVKAYKSGPLGGDQQIGALIADGAIDLVIFFSDPLEAQPHDPDIKALMRIAAVYDIPFANNRATADFIMKSSYLNDTYTQELKDFTLITQNRAKTIGKTL